MSNIGSAKEVCLSCCGVLLSDSGAWGKRRRVGVDDSQHR